MKSWHCTSLVFTPIPQRFSPVAKGGWSRRNQCPARGSGVPGPHQAPPRPKPLFMPGRPSPSQGAGTKAGIGTPFSCLPGFFLRQGFFRVGKMNCHQGFRVADAVGSAVLGSKRESLPKILEKSLFFKNAHAKPSALVRFSVSIWVFLYSANSFQASAMPSSTAFLISPDSLAVSKMPVAHMPSLKLRAINSSLEAWVEQNRSTKPACPNRRSSRISRFFKRTKPRFRRDCWKRR